MKALNVPASLMALLACVAGAMFSTVHAENARDDSAPLRRVADHVLAQTTRRLIDRSSGETFTDSTGLAPKPEISIESKFNAWFYQTWLLADGMRRTAAALDEPRYRDYGEQNLEFIFRHMDYFQRQHAAKMKAAPVGDGDLSPIGFHFEINALWHTGLAPLVLERYAATNYTKYEPFLMRMRKFLTNSPQFEDGAFYRRGKGMMTDDPYMTVPFLVRDWQRTGVAQHLDSAIAQVLGTHARLLDAEHGLLRHLWDLKTQKPAGAFWGRGNGWTVLAHVELLSALPKDHPRRAEVLAAFVRHMTGVRTCADPEGGWHQVLDHPESWLETSATGMLTYGIARGVNEGWLDVTFADTARNGWKALQSKVTPEGDLTDVCGSTDTGDLAYYMKRPRLKGDLHGFGSFLLAGGEIVRLPAKSGVPKPSAAPRNDAAWLREKGSLLFQDTFERQLDGNGIKAIGNGWESATADRAPNVKQADLDGGILKIRSDGKAAGHGVHIHHDAGFADGGTTLRFRFPGESKGETFTVGHVDREMKGVHAGHLSYAILSLNSILLRDNKTGISDDKLRARRAVFLDKKEKLPADLEALLQTKEKTVLWKADNEWHDLALAFEGDEMRLSIDGKLVASHRSEGFAHPAKRWLSFSAANTVWIDDVRIFKMASTQQANAKQQHPWAFFTGKEAAGAGKHIVFITGDDEYKSEQSMPMMAQILAERHGFDCTVLFAINKATGAIDMNQKDNIPGLKALNSAHLMVMFTRFRALLG